jgi:hypothetical protein
MVEEWKVVNDYSNYHISNTGRLKNISRNQFIVGSKDVNNYVTAKLSKNNICKSKKIHRLVAEAFLPNPENKKTVNHKDHNPENNDVSNLEWATSREQNIHKRKPSKEHQREVIGTPVYRLDVCKNEAIQEYNSLSSAAEWCLENDLTSNPHAKSAIHGACKTGRTTYGFKWKYKELQTLDNEEWRPVPPDIVKGIEGYKVSNLGRIKNANDKVRKGWNCGGYIQVSVGRRQSYLLHILVATVFVPNSDPDTKIEVNHKDKNKANAEATNLEWVSHSQNVQHSVDTGVKNTKKVIQYDLNGNEVGKYDSFSQAARKIGITKNNNIGHVVNTNNVAYGFFWRNENVPITVDDKITYSGSTKHFKKVLQYDLNMNFIREFNSTNEVADIFGVNRSSIGDCCRGNSKTSCGFIFRYKTT